MMGLFPGDTAPWFHAPALGGNPSYAFESVGGRYLLLLFFGSAPPDRIRNALSQIQRSRAVFDDTHACYFGIVRNEGSVRAHDLAQQLPGIRFLLDFDGQVHELYARGSPPDEPRWLLLDPTIRVVAGASLGDGDAILARLGELIAAPPAVPHAPVLVVPRILEPQLCRELIDHYHGHDLRESGFMRDIDGKTVAVLDHNHKRRTDCVIGDTSLQARIGARLKRLLVPQIARVFQFNVTRIERWIIACYDAETGGHFRPHRDNTTKGTAHRRFACTINLNADEYEGGDLRFPEYGRATYRAPTGGAVIFSCSLLHEATPLTEGHRFAFLPFFYDEAAAAIRQANQGYLAKGEYRPDTPANAPAEARAEA